MSIAREMMAKKFQPGQSLEKNGQGIRYLIQLSTQKENVGLGYTSRIKKRNPYKKIPFQLYGVLIPRVNEPNPDTAVQDNEEEILIPPPKKRPREKTSCLR